MALPSPLQAFVWGAGGAALTPEQIARQREIADALLAKAGDTSPVASWTQGAARVADAISGKIKESRLDKAEGANYTANSSILQSLLQGGTSGFPGAPSSGAFPAAPGAGASASGAADYGGDQLAWTDAKPYQKALLNTISGPESGGHYNVIYGGGKFDDFSRHPGKAVHIQTGPNAGRTSSAAGKYQFLGSTWDDQAKKLGLPDFSPANQDKAAWNLAAETYQAKTGQSLDDALQSGDPETIASVGKVLNPIWTSLPGGIEQGTNTNKFVATYQRALGAGATPAQATQVAATEQAQQPVQVASLDPSAGMTPAPASLATMAPGTTAPAYDPSGLPPLDPNDPMAPVPQAGPAQGVPVNALQDPAGSPAATTPAGQRVVQALINPQSMTGGAPMPMQGAQVPPQLQQPVSDPQQQVAQAQDLSQLPVMAGGTADAIQAGQAQQGINPAIIEALSNPAASEQTRKIAGMLLQQQMQSQDPSNQLDMKYKQAQIDALNAKPDKIPDSVRALDIRAQQAGLQPGTKEYQQFMISGGSGPQTVINTGSNTSKFLEKSDEAAAKRMDEIVTAGQSAPQTLSDMQQLLDLGSQIGTGKEAQVKAVLGPYAQSLGINIDGMPEIQAYQAITSRLAPQMRAVGSGSSSDTDVALFMQSLPNLKNTPQGNEIIANTMKAVAQNKVNAAGVARKAQRGEISWQDADEQISKLPNPYDLFKDFQKSSQKKTVIDGFTIEEMP